MSESLSWFRMYAEAVDDEKLRLLAFEDRWHFVALLCCKATGFLDEPDHLTRRKVAIKLGVDLATLDEIARRLAEVGLIDRETLLPLAWNTRQFRSDHDTTTAERQRRYRERVSNALRNVTVTRTEAEAEAETYLSEKIESPKPAPKARKSRSPVGEAPSMRGSRIPVGFPDPDCKAWAATERPDLDVARVTAKFRDYWIGVPGQRGRKADWAATWRNFVRTERAPPPRAGPADRNSAAVAGLTGRTVNGSKPHSEVIDVVATAAPAIAGRLGR